MNKLFVRITLVAAMALPSAALLANTEELDAHLTCAAVFIQLAQMTSGDASAGWGEYAVQVMGLASELSSVDAVQSDLRERVPARHEAFASDVTQYGQPAAEERLMGVLTACGNRYGLLE